MDLILIDKKSIPYFVKIVYLYNPNNTSL